MTAAPRCTNRSPRAGFTLVELLVTIVIIGMLAAVFLGALQVAQQSARRTNTEGLVRKLHNHLLVNWESYRTRRVPLGNSVASTPETRLVALRELMRMEMPERWDDVDDAPKCLASSTVSGSPSPYVSSQQWRYVQKYKAAEANGATLAQLNANQNAECLYLLVESTLPEEMTMDEMFSSRDIGDADGDGLLEFHDAWGTPIRFLRWAPGFVSELQPIWEEAIDNGDVSDTAPWLARYLTDTSSPLHNAPSDTTDPFNSRRLNVGTINLSNGNVKGGAGYVFSLLPLVYSAGPDRVFDVWDTAEDVDASTGFKYSSFDSYPYTSMESSVYPNHPPFGATGDFDNDGDDNSQDNIHGHLMGLR